MHELSIAKSIIENICNELNNKNINYQKLKTIKLKIGILTQIVPCSLQFGLEVFLKQLNLNNVKIIITEQPIKFKCNLCNTEQIIKRNEFIQELILKCNYCNAFDINIISGKELLIESIEIDD